MKIAILTSGILPIPAVKGGAVENLIDFYLEYNAIHKLHDITVYSVGDKLTEGHPALQSDINSYHYIEIWSLWAKVRKRLHKLFHGEKYYHYTIEYYLAQALKDIRNKDFDIIIVENRPGYVPIIAQKTKARIVIHLHNDFLNKETKWAQAIFDATSRVITVSDYIGQRVKTIDPKTSKCTTVMNGINLKNFSAQHVTAASRASLGLSEQDFVVVYSGRMNKEKGIAELIDAVAQLKDHPDIKLLVIGGAFFGDNSNDNPFTKSLKEKAQALANRIVFTGFVPYEHVPSYLKTSNLAVIPSQWEEPFGLTCLEAMATGIPIIATKKGGIPEILKDNFAEILPTGNDFVERLSKAILNLYQHPEEQKKMGLIASQESMMFSKERYAEEFFNALSF